MTLRILLSAAAAQDLRGAIADVLADRPHVLVTPEQGVEADIAFVTRDVTGLSTKHQVLPDTQRFYDALEASRPLRWLQIHSAGTDRPVYQRLQARGVQLATASGVNALVVTHTALAGVLALARRLPQLWRAQQEQRWASLMADALPRDLEGQHAVLVGWGPIGQRLGPLLQALGLRVTVVRQQDSPVGGGLATVPAARWREVLPQADWLLLACPLTPQTRGMVDAAALALLPRHSYLINVARGELVEEPALVAALQQGRLAGAFLDTFAQEPLPADSPLWSLPNVIATPHSAGLSDGNAARVRRLFLDNLRRWVAGEPLLHLAPD
ncbi:D-2-hydroxyacid dehydrogenase [Ramlibacter sp. G-1-2-2]|uniref:D-2-hydroxyacid dehydrogenase n=1 Tax=Ramlibacter agri TaxID=2728837 RepID=A0A848H341_9BURK|nr:D-2-hydroxyacid dehydrogenase [Ramlibacter agri]NML42208.1 D-2-hydroxyacid dehydrogenase [Ramlibacter agri]